MLLLVVAALMGRGISQVWRADPGFTTEGLFAIQPDTRRRSPGGGDARPRYSRELVLRLRATPGVSAAGLTAVPPFFGTGMSRAGVNPTDALPVVHGAIDDEFFATLGVRAIAGRLPAAGEDDVVVVNARLARMFWGDAGAAVGQTLFVPSRGRSGTRPMRVVGVTPTLQSTAIGVADEPKYYTSLNAAEASNASVVVRADETVPLQQIDADDWRRLAEKRRRA